MQFKGIELHNVRELIKGEYGYVLSRLPSSLGDIIKGDPKTASGVELRLVPISDEVKIKIKRVLPGVTVANIYYGSIQSGWRELYKPITYEPCEISVKRSTNLETLRGFSERIGAAFSPEVVRIVLQSGQYEIIDVEGECRVPTAEELPKRTYLAYGSSITHGSLSITPCRSYPFIISERLGADYLNFGYAGSARLEPEMADFIADECEFDFASIEMGINMLKVFDPEELRTRVNYFVKRIATAHPTKPIYATSIFYHSEDFLKPGDETSTTSIFRKVIKETVLALDLPNVTFVDGLSILSGVEYLSEDTTHPNAEGIEMIAKGFLKVMKNGKLKVDN